MASPAKIAQALPIRFPRISASGWWKFADNPLSIPTIESRARSCCSAEGSSATTKVSDKGCGSDGGSTIAPLFNAATFNAAQDVLPSQLGKLGGVSLEKE